MLMLRLMKYKNLYFQPSNFGPASTVTVSASPDGVFRVPVASAAIHHPKSITTLTDKELVQHLNPGINVS